MDFFLRTSFVYYFNLSNRDHSPTTVLSAVSTALRDVAAKDRLFLRQVIVMAPDEYTHTEKVTCVYNRYTPDECAESELKIKNKIICHAACEGGGRGNDKFLCRTRFKLSGRN